MILEFGSEFAEGWVESAETTFLLPKLAAIGTVPNCLAILERIEAYADF